MGRHLVAIRLSMRHYLNLRYPRNLGLFVVSTIRNQPTPLQKPVLSLENILDIDLV